ncbi:acetyltransferase [Crocinitomix sp.]|nr:acetyltransferase [Crocinitomix sp.]
MKTLQIIGAGGHTRSLLSLLDELDCYNIEGVYDNSYAKFPDEIIGNYHLKGNLNALSATKELLVVSIGNNAKRKAFVDQFSDCLLKENLISKFAIIRDDVVFGFSNQIFPQVFINSLATVGNHCIVNSKALIEHESSIGDFCHIAVGAIICGRVKVGNNCMIGAGSVIKNNIKICDDVIIGAGAVVVNNIDSPGTYVGNPLRRIS